MMLKKEKKNSIKDKIDKKNIIIKIINSQHQSVCNIKIHH